MVPSLGTLNNRCRTIIGTQKGTIILTTTHLLLRPEVTVGLGAGGLSSSAGLQGAGGRLLPFTMELGNVGHIISHIVTGAASALLSI